MRTSTIIALAASSLASASPLGTVDPPATAHFHVSKFVFGCSAGCNWSFNVTVEGEAKNHPELKTPVTCSGGLDQDKDYKKCDVGAVSKTQQVLAYIDKDTNELKLQYAVNNLEEHKTYRYYGEKEVYAATSDKGKLQQDEFDVPETDAAVA
ncbi:hypothetical protein AC579_4597 [Pseudocercospora musae]|uniref:AA1-like domain-containing protein n=1 Tax=Pseudocercospora musae TaxID=113226 RepID=A0A139ITI5_9PEZI|nr:hypothetical protein AC579_4597 [Pseudocercospora musae]